jgi:hypothetical protein
MSKRLLLPTVDPPPSIEINSAAAIVLMLNNWIITSANFKLLVFEVKLKAKKYSLIQEIDIKRTATSACIYDYKTLFIGCPGSILYQFSINSNEDEPL